MNNKSKSDKYRGSRENRAVNRDKILMNDYEKGFFKPGHFRDMVIPMVNHPCRQNDQMISSISDDSESTYQESKLYDGIRDEIRRVLIIKGKNSVISCENARKIEEEIMHNIENEIEPLYEYIDSSINTAIKDNECKFCNETNCLISHEFDSKLTIVNGKPIKLFVRLRLDLDDAERHPNLDIQHGYYYIDDKTGKEFAEDGWSDSFNINACPICGRELKPVKTMIGDDNTPCNNNRPNTENEQQHILQLINTRIGWAFNDVNISSEEKCDIFKKCLYEIPLVIDEVISTVKPDVK